MRRVAAVGLIVVLGSACTIDVGNEDDGPIARRDFELTQLDGSPPPSRTAEIVQNVLPSVVNVRVSSLDLDEGGLEGAGQGSGVIIDPNGIILTNNHVVSGAARVRVVFNDETMDPAVGRVLGTLPESDIAVIEVDASDLDPIDIGKSSSMRLGDDVLAVGFPLGLGGVTVTKGIISATGRDIEVGDSSGGAELELKGLIQTDAAINPGNSGGALVNALGQLIGINTAAAGAASAENVGFAIPIDTALPLVQEILSEPIEKRGWLGVQVDVVRPEYQDLFDVEPGQEGVVIVGVFPDSPAEEADLEQGDVIETVDGDPIETPQDLTEKLVALDPGSVVTLRIVRPDGAETVRVELAQRPAQFELQD